MKTPQSECYAAELTGIFVFRWATFFAETALLAGAVFWDYAVRGGTLRGWRSANIPCCFLRSFPCFRPTCLLRGCHLCTRFGADSSFRSRLDCRLRRDGTRRVARQVQSGWSPWLALDRDLRTGQEHLRCEQPRDLRVNLDNDVVCVHGSSSFENIRVAKKYGCPEAAEWKPHPRDELGENPVFKAFRLQHEVASS